MPGLRLAIAAVIYIAAYLIAPMISARALPAEDEGYLLVTLLACSWFLVGLLAGSWWAVAIPPAWAACGLAVGFRVVLENAEADNAGEVLAAIVLLAGTIPVIVGVTAAKAGRRRRLST